MCLPSGRTWIRERVRPKTPHCYRVCDAEKNHVRDAFRFEMELAIRYSVAIKADAKRVALARRSVSEMISVSWRILSVGSGFDASSGRL
jgi:hypothetical protein